MSSHGRHPSSQLIKIRNQTFLVDCGEGTQFQLQKYKCKPFKINCIFISHLHGDHYFGLIGLLTTYQLLRRESKLIIVGPPAIKDIIDLQLAASQSVLTYPIEYVFTQDKKTEVIFDNEEVQVTSIPLLHRIPCTGFVFKEKKNPRKINSEAVRSIKLSSDKYKALSQGEDIVDENGVFHSNSSLTFPGEIPRSYAYCSDTVYLPSIVPHIFEVDLLYHESTFMHSSLDRAEATFHSTTIQAAEIAKAAQAHRLIIGHFSSKYPELDELLDECRSVFPASDLAIEGVVFSL